MEIHVIHYLIISTVMMFCGIYGFFTRRNLLALLISVELMLNATNINFAVFNRCNSGIPAAPFYRLICIFGRNRGFQQKLIPYIER